MRMRCITTILTALVVIDERLDYIKLGVDILFVYLKQLFQYFFTCPTSINTFLLLQESIQRIATSLKFVSSFFRSYLAKDCYLGKQVLLLLFKWIHSLCQKQISDGDWETKSKNQTRIKRTVKNKFQEQLQLGPYYSISLLLCSRRGGLRGKSNKWLCCCLFFRCSQTTLSTRCRCYRRFIFL